MEDAVVIPSRFRGPPNSANGGYACGVVGGLLGGPVEVTLRRPPPLDTPLQVSRPDRDQAHLLSNGEVIAEGRTISDALEAPPPVDLATSIAATARYRGFDPGATFDSCFVCSPVRHDGLRIFPGPVDDVLAAPWTPDPNLVGSNGRVPEAIVWAALDCPTFFASTEPGQPALLGRMAASIEDAVLVGEPYVVVARQSGRDGRKRYGISALYSAGGEVLARARATWITIEQ